jgi:hypothetical protein
LVLAFCSPEQIHNAAVFSELKTAFPQAIMAGCTTAGEIHHNRVHDNSISVTAISLEKTPLRMANAAIPDSLQSFEAGQNIGQALAADDLSHILVFSDGLINGSKLVEGISRAAGKAVTLTGGLAADSSDFKKTFVLVDGAPCSGHVTGIGFYGSSIKVGCGSLGGWDPFGPERLVTRSHGNVLFELDDESALALYKNYLGEHAAGLPASGLLFPLSMRMDGSSQSVVRTILGVNESDQSLTFAGDLPEGSYVQLMKANFERLIDGAAGAAHSSHAALGEPADLALLISCVGRRLVLKQRVEEEIEAVRGVLGPHVSLAGFYSYGEIAPFIPQNPCALHNQTMTITTFAER